MSTRSYKHYVLYTLLVVYTFNFIDRQILAVLMEPIKHDLGLSDTQLGFLSGIAFALFYCTLGLPIARWADRGNRVTIISLAIAIWSGMTALCGLAGNYLQLVLARIGVGVGEAGCTPPAHSLIGDYFTRAERPRAISIYMLGTQLGALLGILIGGWVNELYGWRMAFFLVGVPGLLLALIVKLTIREPRGEGIQSAALPELEPLPALREVFLHLWRRRAFRHLMLANSLAFFMGAGISTWWPAFYIRLHGMTTGELGNWLAFTSLGAAIGVYLGGYMATRFGANDERMQLRLLALSVLVALPLALGVILSPDRMVSLILLFFAGMAFSVFMGPSLALVQGLAASNMRAMAVAVVFFITNLAGLGLGPQAAGLLSDLLKPHYGENALRVAMVVMSFVALWAAVHFWLAGRTIQADLVVAGASDSDSERDWSAASSTHP